MKTRAKKLVFFVFEKIYCMSYCKSKLYVLKLTKAILETDETLNQQIVIEIIFNNK